MKNTTISIPDEKKEFKKILYIGDLHSSHFLEGFINSKKFNESYYIVLCGDLFDRGDHSAEVYETVRKLHEQWRLTLVLGNHDLFLSAGFWMRGESHSKFAEKARSVLSDIDRAILCEIFTDQFYSNGGNSTMISFTKAYGTNLATKVDEIIDFLMQFGLYTIDPSNNLVIHGGIPILVDGSVVGETIDGKFVYWLDYVRELSKGLSNLDRNTLYRLTGREYHLGARIYEDMEKNGAIRDPVRIKGDWDYTTWMLPHWLCNRIFTDPRYTEAQKALRTELDSHSLGRMICGHWRNDSQTFGKPNDPEMKKYGDTIIRLDRSGYAGYGSFWYAVVDIESNTIEEVWDSIDFMRK